MEQLLQKAQWLVIQELQLVEGKQRVELKVLGLAELW
jgi:hypothetical protein